MQSKISQDAQNFDKAPNRSSLEHKWGHKLSEVTYEFLLFLFNFSRMYFQFFYFRFSINLRLKVREMVCV